MKEKKEKTKYSAPSNVFYMLKTLCRGSKGYVIYTFIKELNEQVFWTVFSVYLTQWIYMAIENKTPLYRTCILCGRYVYRAYLHTYNFGYSSAL